MDHLDNDAILKPGEIREYTLNDFSKGFAEVIDNCWTYSIFATDPNATIFENEFNAGFIQGKVQGKRAIRAARNNVWRNMLICDTPQENITIDIPDAAHKLVEDCLYTNYVYLYDWLASNPDDRAAIYTKRLLFRMAGIHAGVQREKCEKITFEDLSPAKLGKEEFKLGHYEDKELTFTDIYFINAQADVFDAISSKMDLGSEEANKKRNHEHCSAFVKYMDDGEIYWTHNSWAGFYVMSCAISYTIGDDFVTQNAICQGQFGSNTDFGFNKNGICFNETTHLYSYNESKELGIWLTWRSAIAEQFATSIKDFYDLISIDNTGTYLSGYQLVDANRNEIGIVEMSYHRFVLFTSDGKELKIIDSTGYLPTKKDYDPHLISANHIFGINCPISKTISYELETQNARPMRRVQFFNLIDNVVDIESAKNLITYTQDKEPLSIYGRWDLGYGTTEMKFRINNRLVFRTRPDGSNDGKAFCASGVREVLKGLSYKPCKDGKKTSFWMKYGTPYIEGIPFIWSQSRFKEFKGSQEDDFVPDAVDGKWNLVKLFME